MHSSLYFGTDGIRGNADAWPFTDQALYILGHAIGRWAHKRYHTPTPKILIGNDTRLSCARIKAALSQGLRAERCMVVNADTLPTPALFFLLTQDSSYQIGIMISASHNPYQDNGIKIFDARSGKLDSIEEQHIVQQFNTYKTAEGLTWHEAPNRYCEGVITQFPPQFLIKKKILLDTAHGATSQVAPAIFRAMGAEVIVLNAAPNGYNINAECGALHPAQLQNAVLTHHADAGFAFDGDGDRVMAVNRSGNIKDGDDALAILVTHPTLAHTPTIVGTLMTNYGLEIHLEQQQKRLLRTSVGDKYIAAALEEHKLLLGGEPSGHLILRNYLPSGDGIFAALKLLETLILTDNWDMRSFVKFPQVIINLPIAYKQPLDAQPLAAIIAHHRQALPQGRVVVRYSGTENVLRIMTEASQASIAQQVADSLAQQLSGILSRPQAAVAIKEGTL